MGCERMRPVRASANNRDKQERVESSVQGALPKKEVSSQVSAASHPLAAARSDTRAYGCDEANKPKSHNDIPRTARRSSCAKGKERPADEE